MGDARGQARMLTESAELAAKPATSKRAEKAHARQRARVPGGLRQLEFETLLELH